MPIRHLNRDRDVHGALHGMDTSGDQRRLRSKQAAKTAVLYPIRRAADIEVDFVVAKILADFRCCGENRADRSRKLKRWPGARLASKPSSRVRFGQWMMAPVVSISV